MRTGNKIVISGLDSDVEDVDGHAMKTNERQVSKLNSIGDLPAVRYIHSSFHILEISLDMVRVCLFFGACRSFDGTLPICGSNMRSTSIELLEARILA